MIMRPLEPTPCISSSCISSSRISPRGSRGTTMLEVLISLLIVCFGLLGAAGMQAFGIKASLSAGQRSAATMLAYEMADRMRANMTGVNAGNYHNYTAAATASCLTVTGCTSVQMAANVAFEWVQNVQATLPSAAAIVCRDSSPDDGTSAASLVAAACDGLGDFYAIKIWWLDDRSEANAGAANKRVVVAFKP